LALHRLGLFYDFDNNRFPAQQLVSQLKAPGTNRQLARFGWCNKEARHDAFLRVEVEIAHHDFALTTD
jgi:hypothetical protein